MPTQPVRRAFGAKAHQPVWGWLSSAVEGARMAGCSRWRLDRAPLDASATPVAACTLLADPASASRARQFTRATLCEWGVGDLADDVAVVASELVGNAVRHGTGRTGRFEEEGPIRLGLVNVGLDVLCAVADPGSQVPVPRAADDLAESGRGLLIVASLSAAWGWTPPDRLGKVVWATFGTPGSASAADHDRAATA